MADAAPLEGEYDYIIVGAGSPLRAGQSSVGRSNNRVLLLEAGGRDNWIWYHIPVGYLFAIGNRARTGCSRPKRCRASTAAR